MHHALKPHVVCGLHRVPGKQMTRKRNVCVLAFVALGNVFVLVESKLCVHPGRRRRCVGDGTQEEEDLVVVRCVDTPSANVPLLDHPAPVTSIFASMFRPIDNALISVAYGGHGS